VLAFLKVTNRSWLMLHVIVDTIVPLLARLTAAGTSMLIKGELRQPRLGGMEAVKLRPVWRG
jgi:hypothetical protein